MYFVCVCVCVHCRYGIICIYWRWCVGKAEWYVDMQSAHNRWGACVCARKRERENCTSATQSLRFVAVMGLHSEAREVRIGRPGDLSQGGTEGHLTAGLTFLWGIWSMELFPSSSKRHQISTSWTCSVVWRVEKCEWWGKSPGNLESLSIKNIWILMLTSVA